jgi:hypothetical protein
MNRIRAIFILVAGIGVAAFGQERSLWRTSADIDEGARGTVVGTAVDVQAGRSRIVLTPDDSPSDRITVDADSVSTQYNGFGGTINGAPEIFVGTTGFANVREGDRIEVRGTGAGNGVVRADRITLLGRPVAASQVGVGQTRTPSSISTPTAGGRTPSTAPERLGRLEGVVRQVNADEGRIVLETSGREILTVRAGSSTPVLYHGDTYRITNLEVGDRVRVDPESGSGASGGEIRARSIEVIVSSQEASGTPSRQIGSLSGRVTRVERTSDMIRVDTGRGQVRVDLTRAINASGTPVRARDVQAGDQVSMTGTYSNDVFVATTVRFTQPEPGTIEVTPATADAASTFDLGLVTIYGTVQTTLDNSPQLVIRDTQSNNRTIRVYVADDFVIKTKSGGYTTADRLRENDSVVVKAYRDADGNYIGQTIRVR